MNNGYNNYGYNPTSNPYQGNPQPQNINNQPFRFLPQPQGGTYFINNSYEVSNIPTGFGVSTIICLSEGLLYLKTFQNGQPMLMPYKISPYVQEQETPPPSQAAEKKENTGLEEISKLEERIAQLEKQINNSKKSGVKLNEQSF